MWRADTTFDNNDKKCGSLKLGTGASNNPNATEAEKMADAKVWKIKVDHLKIERQNLDREEAEQVLDIAQKMDYETMFQKKQKEIEVDEQAMVPVKKAKKEKKNVDAQQEIEAKAQKKLDDLALENDEDPGNTDEAILNNAR